MRSHQRRQLEPQVSAGLRRFSSSPRGKSNRHQECDRTDTRGDACVLSPFRFSHRDFLVSKGKSEIATALLHVFVFAPNSAAVRLLISSRMVATCSSVVAGTSIKAQRIPQKPAINRLAAAIKPAKPKPAWNSRDLSTSAPLTRGSCSAGTSAKGSLRSSPNLGIATRALTAGAGHGIARLSGGDGEGCLAVRAG